MKNLITMALQLTTTRGKREAGRAVSKKDFFEEEHKKPVEDKVKIEKEVVKNKKQKSLSKMKS